MTTPPPVDTNNPETTSILLRMAVAAAFCCGSVLAQAADPVVMEGFETSTATPSDSGWAFTGTTGRGIQRNGSAWGAPPAPEGQQTAYLQGGDAKISKRFYPGSGVYTLSFYAARRDWGKDLPNSIMVKIDGKPIVAKAIAPKGTSFERYTTDRFPLASPNGNTVELSSTVAGDHTTFIDKVTIDRDDYKIGVYYYPGWKDTAATPKPWLRLQGFVQEQRKPLLGWYDEGTKAVAESHINSMADYGIDFVMYDWYWENGAPAGTHALDAYLQANNHHRVNFSLMWDVRTTKGLLPGTFENVVNYWIDNYFRRPQYHKIDGKPAVMLFPASVFTDYVGTLKSPTTGNKMRVSEMLQKADDMAKARGLQGIYFINAIDSGEASNLEFWLSHSQESGFSAASSYNLHSGVGPFVPSHSYAELSEDYNQPWTHNLNWAFKNANPTLPKKPLQYIIPMTSGWDKRGWGGTVADPLHDLSFSDPASFAAHLRAAKAQMDRRPAQSAKIGIICCWNEFGEGSYIEPTETWGTQYLETVRQVFHTP